MLSKIKSSRPAVCTMSLGRAWIHKLPYKLDQAQQYGFQGVELFYEDLEYFAQDVYGNSNIDSQVLAAEIVRTMCQERGLEIICLQPFMHYGGLRDREAHRANVEQLKGWFRIIKALNTNMIVFPSSFLNKEELRDDNLETVISDFQEVADLGAQEEPIVQFGYESLAWGTLVDTWEKCWEVVKRVNRSNFGICLDTFNIAGRAYADPASPTGRVANAQASMKASLTRLIQQIDIKKIVFLQLADAERLLPPIQPGHEYYDIEKPARLCWSRNCRLFYGEEGRGAYLPTRDIVWALIHDMGYKGWISHEVFSRDMADTDPNTPAKLAYRAAISWSKLHRDMAQVVRLQDEKAGELAIEVSSEICT